jgi:hypothetical protein
MTEVVLGAVSMVLALGFTKTRELIDPEDGPLWRWELALTAC